MITEIQLEGNRKDRDTASILSQIPSYPCARCKYWKFPNGDIDCANKSCGKWLSWFREFWPYITKLIAEQEGNKK